MNAGSGLIVRNTPQGTVFQVRVHPRAKHTAIMGIIEGRLKLALASPPIEGRANDELQRFLAQLFNTSRSAVVILAGDHSRKKRILITDRDGGAILAAIEHALPASKPPIP